MHGLFKYTTLRPLFPGWSGIPPAMLQKEKLGLHPTTPTPAKSWACIQTWMFPPESNFFLPTPTTGPNSHGDLEEKRCLSHPELPQGRPAQLSGGPEGTLGGSHLIRGQKSQETQGSFGDKHQQTCHQTLGQRPRQPRQEVGGRSTASQRSDEGGSCELSLGQGGCQVP